MKKKELIITIIIFFIAVSLITSLSYFITRERFHFTGAESVETINMSLEVGDKIGINTGGEMLYFGIVMPGSSAMRIINITNMHPYSISVKLFKEGNISDFISFYEETIVGPNKSGIIPITASVPLNRSFESYSGRLTVALFPI